jgi:hypothetical protein
VEFTTRLPVADSGLIVIPPVVDVKLTAPPVTVLLVEVWVMLVEAPVAFRIIPVVPLRVFLIEIFPAFVSENVPPAAETFVAVPSDTAPVFDK